MTKGQRIKARREELGIAQTDLAEKIKISKQTLYKYENDIVTNIPSDKVEELASALECTPAYLMGWENGIVIETEANNNEHSEIIKKYIKLLSENVEMAPYIDKLRQLPPEYRNIAYTSINSVYEAYILTKEKEHEENNG